MTLKFGTGLYGQTLYSAGSPVEISGTMAINVGFAATANIAFGLSGVLPIVPVFKGGRLNGDFLVSGEMDLTIGFPAADMVAGPLWDQDALCQGQWTPDTLCADPGWTADPDVPQSPPWGPSELCNG